MRTSKRLDISSEAGCTAKGPMMNCGYTTYFLLAEQREKKGEIQNYCATCGLCRWPEEQASCPKWAPSPELDKFYEEEAKK